MLRSKDWWREAVVYQIYPRSYADASNDGIGDIPGIRTKVPYLKELGIDAVWLSPHYPSPMLDAGYDVSNYRDVEPIFGKLSDIDGLIADLHAAGMQLLLQMTQAFQLKHVTPKDHGRGITYFVVKMVARANQIIGKVVSLVHLGHS
jgi:1,4-alpha-glucan branching enzyme